MLEIQSFGPSMLFVSEKGRMISETNRIPGVLLASCIPLEQSPGDRQCRALFDIIGAHIRVPWARTQDKQLKKLGHVAEVLALCAAA